MASPPTRRVPRPEGEESPLTRRLPWHPIGFAAVVVVSLWVGTAVSPYSALRSLAVAIVGAGVIWLVAGLATRSFGIGAFVASGVIGLLWSKQLAVGMAETVDRIGILAALWGGLIVLAGLLVVRIIRRRWHRFDRDGLTLLLNRAALLLLVATLLVGLANGHLAALGDDLDQGVAFGQWPAGEEDSTAERPDMYVILLDGYPRADVLEYAFGWDNTAFVESLAARGFTVAQESRSDYLWTHTSLPSALNLAYVEQIPAMQRAIEGSAPRQPTLRTTVADSVAFQVAREHGYVTASVGGGFEELAPRRADVYLDGGQLNEFELSLLESTFASNLLNLVAPDFASGQHRARIEANLEFLPRIADRGDRDPTLVFAHVPAPHQPAVVGASGEPVAVPISANFFADSPTERGEDPDEFADRYRGQLAYLNDRVLDTIDAIVERSSVPPVIVLFADHGSASQVDWTQTEIEDADPARLLERTGTLFAALTPGRDGIFPDDITPVDLFRLLYDAYLGTDYGRAVPPEGGAQVTPPDASVLDD